MATIKPSGADGLVGIYTYPGGKVYAGNATLIDLIQNAFALQAFQVKNASSWMEQRRYDVTALPPESSASRTLNPPSIKTPLSREQQQMLQTLLQKRFGLTFHWETRSGPIFLLERTGKTLGMVATKDATKLPYMNVLVYADGVGNGEIIGENTTMSFMATRLSRLLGRTVNDRTGLSGSFDFRIESPEPANADQTDAVLSGLSRLGLRLRSTKGDVLALMIDGAHPPTEN